MRIHPLAADAFALYGSVVRPPDGPPTASDATFRFWSDLARYEVEGETEIGLCTVVRQAEARVDWLERHRRTPEVLVPVDAPVLLPVSGDGDAVVCFRVEPGEAVVLAPGVWHSAALPAGTETATYLVLFRRGTPAEDVEKRAVEPVALRSTAVPRDVQPPHAS